MKHFYLWLLPLVLTGCFQTRDENSLTVQVRSTRKTNHGTPLYVVIKETSMTEFLVDDYHEIVAQSFWKEGEGAPLVKKVLVPGKTDKFDLSVPSKDKSIGLYFIFTNPGECWKYFVDRPQSKKVKVLLGNDQYEAVNVYQS